MTDPSFEERFGRLTPVREVPRVASGSPAVLTLRPAAGRELQFVSASLAVAKRGLTLLEAKRAIEKVLSEGCAEIEVPVVESLQAMARDLEAAGCEVEAAALLSSDPCGTRKDIP